LLFVSIIQRTLLFKAAFALPLKLVVKTCFLPVKLLDFFSFPLFLRQTYLINRLFILSGSHCRNFFFLPFLPFLFGFTAKRDAKVEVFFSLPKLLQKYFLFFPLPLQPYLHCNFSPPLILGRGKYLNIFPFGKAYPMFFPSFPFFPKLTF
jgi:hypothetical protein